jgi:hypothetical protein
MFIYYQIRHTSGWLLTHLQSHVQYLAYILTSRRAKDKNTLVLDGDFDCYFASSHHGIEDILAYWTFMQK